MATMTRLASTLTAKYYPSQTLTDAFYMDGRLCGKRETRQADITIDKEERGFFFSVFTHPAIQGFEPGTLPPYEPQLRGMCNEVKFGHKEIDGMIEKFLSTAVDVTGKMRLTDSEERSPYFSGIIVRDSEAFAVTIGNGLAFLYRDDTLFPLTDAGIPMEPIDAYGNRVGDFMYYCSSKTANALWSNFFTLSPDDCIILCNKAVYDALGQREILRILNDAEDQCDAAGVVITQASARMPNVPMQFSISFVESVTSDEKRGLFGFKKKAKEEDTSDMSIKSTVDGGVVGAAASAIADAGFVSFDGTEEVVATETAVAAETESFAATAAAGEGAFVVGAAAGATEGGIEFLDNSVSAAQPEEVSAEEMMKKLFGDMKKAEEEDKQAVQAAIEVANEPIVTEEPVVEQVVAEQPKEEENSPFVFTFDEDKTPVATEVTTDFASVVEEETTETVLATPFTPEVEDEPTKPVDASILNGLKADGIIAEALREMKTNEEPEVVPVEEVIIPEVKEEEPAIIVEESIPEVKVEEQSPFVIPENKEVTPPEIQNKPEEIVFAPSEVGADFFDVATPNAEDTFNPYSVGSSEEMQNAAPLVFGDDVNHVLPVEEPSEEVEEIPVPDFKLDNPKPEIKEEDKLNVDFPEFAKVEETPVVVEETPAEVIEEEPVEVEAPVEGGFVLPFANGAETAVEPEEIEEIPPMPTYGGNAYETPVNAVGSEEPVAVENENVIAYGVYEDAAADTETAVPYQPYGSETFTPADQPTYGAPITNAYEASQPQYQGATEEVYEEQSYQEDKTMSEEYNPNRGYTEPQTASASSTQGSADDDWIMGILGMDDSVPEPAPYSVPVAATKSQYNPGPTKGPNAAQSSRPRPQTAPGNGNGGNRRGGKVKMKLNRNGYIFLAFVTLLIIGLIVIVSLIAKSCNGNEDPQTTATSTTNDVLVTTESAATQPTQPAVENPSAPIGRFTFSDYIGYRTWWDLFHAVYNVDLADTSDPRIKKLVEYNGLDASTYKPNSGDSLLLPPQGVLDGTIENTFTVGGGSSESSETTAPAIEGEVTIIDGEDQA